VVGNLLQVQLSKDKNFQQVQRELAAAKNDVERAEKLKAVGDIAQGTVIGKVFQDRQALMALYGYINARERVNKIANDSAENADAVDRNFDVIRDTASYKTDQAASARDMAFQTTMDKMMPAIGGVADGLTGLMTQYPGYTTAVAAAAAAVTGLAGAAGLAALALRGGGAGLPGGVGGGVSGGTAASAGRFAGFASLAAKMLGPLMLLESLTQPSEKDIATLRRMDAEEAAKKAGHRGKGFNDPRVIGSGFSAADLEKSLRASEVKGEILVRVTAPPGLQVETSATSSNPRIPMKAALGQTNMAAGY
jgi:hypothetical protein